MTRLSNALIVIGLAAASFGCDESSSNMGEQPKAKIDAASDYFADGASARPRVAGTIEHVDPVPTTMPLAITRERLEQGQTAFDVSCSACHGRLGNGDGMIAARGLTRPPSFHVPRLRDSSDAHLYDVETNGHGAMFGFGDRLPADTRWEIVSYVRALQAAPDLANLSAVDRAALWGIGDPNTPPAADVARERTR